jgi:hypothetical protein
VEKHLHLAENAISTSGRFRGPGRILKKAQHRTEQTKQIIFSGNRELQPLSRLSANNKSSTRAN